jgi:hypothetical protein
MSEKTEYTIIMIGSAAGSKALSLLGYERESYISGSIQDLPVDRNAEIRKRYPVRYLDEAGKRIREEICKTVDYVQSTDFAKLAAQKENIPKDDLDQGTISVFECTGDGVFGALWRLGETLTAGLEVNLYDIPIDQAVIELCDHEDINPYETDSLGAYLVAAKTPGTMLKNMEEHGITARIIGYTTAENARVIKGPTVRYLTRA